MGYIRYPDANFLGGSGGGEGSSLQTITDFELAGLTGSDVNTLNTILDTYNSDIVAKVNTEIVSSVLQLQGSNLTGSGEHELKVTQDMASVEGGIVATLHNLPVQSVSGNDMVVLGDATGVLVATKRVIIMQKLTQLGRTTHLGLVASDGNIARLEIDSVSYNAGNDETTVTFLNPDLLDLSMGIAAPNQPDELRLAPFD